MKSDADVVRAVKFELATVLSVVDGIAAKEALIRNRLFLFDDVTDAFDSTQTSISQASRTVGDAPPNGLAKLLKTLKPNVLAAIVRRSANRTYTLIETVGATA